MACRKAGRRARARLRPLVAALGRRRRLAAAARGLRLALRAARPRRAAQRRQRRHRRLHRDRPGQPAAAGLRGRDRRPLPRRATRPAFDADGNEVVGELGELVIRQPMPSMPVRLLERPRRLALPRGLLRRLPRRLAPRRLDRVHRARQLGDHRPLRRHAQPRRRAAGDGRVLPVRRGARRGARQPRRPPRGRRTSCSSSSCCATGLELDDALRRASPARCATRCRRATCRTRSWRCRRSRAR